MHELYPCRHHRAAPGNLTLLSLATLLAFVGLSVEVNTGATMRQDVALLRRIHSIFPAWLEVPMQAVTALGHYSVVILVLLVADYLFLCKGYSPCAFLLVIPPSAP
jgi:undecaprenyl-diphosphatase